MQVMDVIFTILIGLLIIHGFIKGLVEALFSWACLILGVWVAVLLFPAGGAFIRERFALNVRVLPELLAFIAIFLLIVVCVKLLERLLKTVIEGARLGTLNKILGALFGVVEGFALSLIIIFVFIVQPLFDASALIENSLIAQTLLPLLRFLPDRAQGIVETFFLVLPCLEGRSV